MRAQEKTGRFWLLVSSAPRVDLPSLLDTPEIAAACGPQPHVVQTSVFEARSSCQPHENAEHPCTLNAYLAIAVVSMLRAQDLANSMSGVWVNTVQQWRNAAAACVCWKVSWAGKSWESVGRQRSALHRVTVRPACYSLGWARRRQPKLALSRRSPCRSLISRSRNGAYRLARSPARSSRPRRDCRGQWHGEGANGVLRTVQLYCPPRICEWQGGWAFFKTGAIMLEELSPAALYVWKKTLADKVQRPGL